MKFKIDLKIEHKRIIRIICMSILMVIFLYSLYQILDYFYESYKSNKIHAELRKKYHTSNLEQDTKPDEHQPQITPPPKEKELAPEEIKPIDIKPVIMERYTPLLEINQDIMGWIIVPDTVIDYPVVQTDNNDYYLDHNINHEEARAGAIFMDFRNQGDGSDRHTILYGHHMRDGSMFKGLIKYKEEEFFTEYNIIHFDTLYEDIEWEVFSVYITDTSFNYIATDFNSEEDYMSFLNTIKNKSMFKKDIDLTKDDSILTLSTCTYEYNDARFVVHAKRLHK